MRAQTIGIALLVLLGAWIALRDTPRVVLGHDGVSGPVSLAPGGKSSRLTTPRRENRGPTAEVETAIPQLGDLEEANARTSTRGEIHGVVIDTDGSPCAHAVVQMVSTPSREVAARSAEPVFEIHGQTTSDERGRFSFEHEGDVERTVAIRLERFGRAPVEWSLQSRPGSSPWVDLQAVHLERTCTLRGSVTDRDGKPLRRGWTVHARRLNAPSGMFRVAATQVAHPAQVAAAPRSGKFEFTSLAPGTYELVTHFMDGIVQRGPEFEIETGEDRDIQIRRQGPDLSAAVLCSLRGTRQLPYDLQSDDFALTDSKGRTHPLKLRGTMLAAYDLEEDEYVLETRGDRFQPARVRGLRPGGLTRTMTLAGIGSLQVDLRSALTGELIESPWIQLRSGEDPPTTQTLHCASDPSSSSLLFTELAWPLRTPTTLVVGAPGWVAESTLELDVDPLRSSRTVEVRLRPGTWIEGRSVVRGTSHPFTGDLEIYVHELSQDGEHWRSAPTAIVHCPGRGDGRFVLEALPHGKLLLEAKSPQGGGAFQSSTIAPALASDSHATPLGIRQVRLEFEEPGYVALELPVLRRDSNLKRALEGYEFRLVHPRGMTVSGTLEGERLSAGPMKPGTWDLQLCSRVNEHAISLAEVSVEPGHHTRVLQPQIPAHVRGELRVDRRPLEGATVRLVSPLAVRKARSQLDGIADLGLVVSGHYELWVEGPQEEPWVLRLPGHLSVEESAMLTRAIDLHRVPGEILLIDGPTASEPLRDTLVTLSWRGEEGWRELEVRTDSRGFLRAELPAGTTFVLSRGGEAAARRDQALPTIEWTRSGASRSVIRLPF